MSRIDYLQLNQANKRDLLEILNDDCLRKHLVDHPYFDDASLQSWMEAKIAIDAIQGCRIRLVSVDGMLAGWCGIQPDDNGFELAIVISRNFWGSGVQVFRSLLHWARELGHNEVLFHLLDSRPVYKALSKMASKVESTELYGRRFTTYYIPVDRR
jgi:hypothetical protein